MAGEQQSWSFRTRAVVMLLAGLPALVVGIKTGQALGDCPLGLRLLAIFGASLCTAVLGSLVAWVVLRKRTGRAPGGESAITIKEFAATTKGVIAQQGFDDFVPTACYPARRQILTLVGLPADIEPQGAVLKWAAKHAKDDEGFLVAFKTAPSEFTVVYSKSGLLQSESFQVESAT